MVNKNIHFFFFILPLFAENNFTLIFLCKLLFILTYNKIESDIKLKNEKTS
jgi:hypothetical protein